MTPPSVSPATLGASMSDALASAGPLLAQAQTRLRASVQTNVQRTMAEAAEISNGTLDFALLLGAALGLLFGLVVPANLSGNLELANTVVMASLFGRVASIMVVFIISLRVILARGMRDQAWVSADDGHHVMLRHVAASSWAAMMALFFFLAAALMGYAVGLMLGLPGLALDMLVQVADNYRVTALCHVGLRVLVEAAAVAWISFFDMILLSARREDLSRSITRKLLLLVAAVLGIEALDAYLYWAIF